MLLLLSHDVFWSLKATVPQILFLHSRRQGELNRSQCVFLCSDVGVIFKPKKGVDGLFLSKIVAYFFYIDCILWTFLW